MTSKDNANSIANMEGLQSAIVAGETARVKELLGDRSLDELQKGYLIELAELNNDSEIIAILKQAPTA
ncbi:hypothetical protein Q4561_12075 [Alteromonas sp. 1_MG-2023]|uniref:hypothetical protein n=1 Tax=Alteromonas sp. 1_MG-2023 TaxID=3062669 RepID=UPI0026E16D77|nr:hypothetical protein [Alteromonas sp. 1_MG-2023]MDO6567799.1 hypothetical protein [Alteromonas sp. 1_MG-2023]